jgi:hypothetical protein
LPCHIDGSRPRGGDGHCGICLNKEEFTSDVKVEVGWARVQEGWVGKSLFAMATKSESNKEKEREQKSTITLVAPGVKTV